MKPRIKYRRQGRKSYLARRRRCVAGLAASLAVLRWRPVVVSWLTDGGSEQRCCCSSGGEREISSSSPLLWFFCFFFLCFVYPWLSFCPLGFVLKKLPSPVSSFPLLFPFSLYSISLCGSFSPSFGLFCFPLCFCFFLCLFLFCPLLLACWRLGPIYRAKGAGGVPIAVHGERPLPALPRCRTRWPISVAGRACLSGSHQ